MAKLIAVYKTPKSVEAFDAHYFSTHIPLAKTIPGLRNYDVNSSVVAGMNGPTGVHMIATLVFDTLEAIQAGLATPQGQAAAADVANFADGGVELFFFDTREV